MHSVAGYSRFLARARTVENSPRSRARNLPQVTHQQAAETLDEIVNKRSNHLKDRVTHLIPKKNSQRPTPTGDSWTGGLEKANSCS